MPAEARNRDDASPTATAAALAAFYAAQGDIASDPYLARKTATPSSHRELAEAFGKIRFALAGAKTILDWGCRHGVFAWLARRELGPDAGIWGCDLCPQGDYAAFHAAAGLQYAQLSHPWHTPFADGSFDVVIGGGTLEHVANDGESLTELWRILKPGGRLVLTHLPNALSISEWLSRRFAPGQAHPRRYRLAGLRRRLLHHGFMPLRWGHHQMIPAHPSMQRAYVVNAALERIWPINRFSTTLWLVAEKRMGF